MKACIAYSYLVNDLFRCLFAEIKIPFVAAPTPGRYTAEIGKAFSGGTLCAGLESVLGSVAECCYLGADTALIFAPCGNCSAQRIKSKFKNCLETNSLSPELLVLEPESASQKLFWQELRKHSPLSLPQFYQSKRRFFECIHHLEVFQKYKRALKGDKICEKYMQSIMKEIHAADSLLHLKLVLLLYNKKLNALHPALLPAVSTERLPYENGDYFNPESEDALENFFQRKHFKKSNENVEIDSIKCPVNGDLSVFLNG